MNYVQITVNKLGIKTVTNRCSMVRPIDKAIAKRMDLKRTVKRIWRREILTSHLFNRHQKGFARDMV